MGRGTGWQPEHGGARVSPGCWGRAQGGDGSSSGHLGPITEFLGIFVTSSRALLPHLTTSILGYPKPPAHDTKPYLAPPEGCFALPSPKPAGASGAPPGTSPMSPSPPHGAGSPSLAPQPRCPNPTGNLLPALLVFQVSPWWRKSSPPQKGPVRSPSLPTAAGAIWALQQPPCRGHCCPGGDCIYRGAPAAQFWGKSEPPGVSFGEKVAGLGAGKLSVLGERPGGTNWRQGRAELL